MWFKSLNEQGGATVESSHVTVSWQELKNSRLVRKSIFCFFRGHRKLSKWFIKHLFQFFLIEKNKKTGFLMIGKFSNFCQLSNELTTVYLLPRTGFSYSFFNFCQSTTSDFKISKFKIWNLKSLHQWSQKIVIVSWKLSKHPGGKWVGSAWKDVQCLTLTHQTQ